MSAQRATAVRAEPLRLSDAVMGVGQGGWYVSVSYLYPMDGGLWRQGHLQGPYASERIAQAEAEHFAYQWGRRQAVVHTDRCDYAETGTCVCGARLPMPGTLEADHSADDPQHLGDSSVDDCRTCNPLSGRRRLVDEDDDVYDPATGYGCRGCRDERDPGPSHHPECDHRAR